MLTKELLRYKYYHDKIIPLFVSEGEVWQQRARDLHTVYSDNIGQKREQLKDALMSLTEGSSWECKVYKGFSHLLDKKCMEERLDEVAYQENRESSFELSTRIIQNSDQCKIAELFKQLEEVQGTGLPLYGDLPSQRKVCTVPDWSPKQLIRRYNLSLLQGLLVYSNKLKLKLACEHSGPLMSLLRMLKFMGLLYEVHAESDEEVELIITGPLTISENPKKYGRQLAFLAGLFPKLPEFNLQAIVELENRKSLLQISSKDKLHSHYAHVLDDIPEDIQNFIQEVDDMLAGYGLKRKMPELPVGPVKEWMVHDFTWQKANKKIHLNIFLANQGKMLERHLKRKVEGNEILGVDKRLVKLLNVEGCFEFNKVPAGKKFIKYLSGRQLL